MKDDRLCYRAGWHAQCNQIHRKLETPDGVLLGPSHAAPDQLAQARSKPFSYEQVLQEENGPGLTWKPSLNPLYGFRRCRAVARFLISDCRFSDLQTHIT